MPTTSGPWCYAILSPITRFILFVVVVALTPINTTMADERPANVTDQAHKWLSEHLDEGMPYMLQTEYGPLDASHIHVVTDLGTWGAARARGKHQGTDFVLDMPHQGDGGGIQIGAPIAGVVAHVAPGYGSYGNAVFLLRDEAPKVIFLFAHVQSLAVESGDRVEVGDLLGVFGCTGNCRGLRNDAERHQVHVEVYALPDDFEADDVSWGRLPMRQLRSQACQDKRKPQAVDITAYFDHYALTPITRQGLADSYAANKKKDGLDAYLSAEEERFQASLKLSKDDPFDNDTAVAATTPHEKAHPSDVDAPERNTSVEPSTAVDETVAIATPSEHDTQRPITPQVEASDGPASVDQLLKTLEERDNQTSGMGAASLAGKLPIITLHALRMASAESPAP